MQTQSQLLVSHSAGGKVSQSTASLRVLLKISPFTVSKVDICMHTRIKRLLVTQFSIAQSAAAGYSVLFSVGILAVCSIFLASEKQKANSAPDQKG
jgi:hypothetical protein